MKHLIIICAGGFGREIYNSALESHGYGEEFDVKGFLDDNPHALDGYMNYPGIIGTIKDYQPEEDDVFVCAVGNVKTRRLLTEEMLAKGGEFQTLIHKTAYVSTMNVKLGVGCLILADARIHCDVTLGDYVIIQPAAILGHDVVVGSWSLINTMSNCGGASRIGECVTIHVNSFIMPMAVIEDDVTVGAGSVALRRVKAGQTVFGVPAKPPILPKVGGAVDEYPCELNLAA